MQLLSAAYPCAQAVHIEIDHRSRIQGKDLADDQAAADGDAQGTAQFGAVAGADGDGNAPEESGHSGHHDGPETQQASPVDRLLGAIAFIAFGLNGEINHQDGVLLDDTDEKNDANQGDDIEVAMSDKDGEQGTHSGGRQSGENGNRVDVVLVEDAQDDVNGGQGREDEVRLGGQRVLEGLRRALKAGMDGGGQADLALHFLNGGDSVSQGDIGGQVKGECDGRKLALVGDGERGIGGCVMGKGAE